MANKKEVAVNEEISTAMAEVNDLASWGDDTQVESKDIILPRLYMMQALSQLVSDDKAKVGDLVNSVTEEKLGDYETPVKFVPFKVEKLWFNYLATGDKPEFESIEPVTAANINRPNETTVDGVKRTHQYALRAYTLVEGEQLPLVITFKSTSLRAGKQLMTEMFVKNKMAGKNPAARYMELISKKEKNDKGTFCVFSLKAGDASPSEMQSTALQWVRTLASTEYAVAGSEEPQTKPETANY